MRKIDPVSDTVLDTDKAESIISSGKRFVVNRLDYEKFLMKQDTTSRFDGKIIEESLFFIYINYEESNKEEIEVKTKLEAKRTAVEWGISEEDYEEAFDVELS